MTFIAKQQLVYLHSHRSPKCLQCKLNLSTCTLCGNAGVQILVMLKLFILLASWYRVSLPIRTDLSDKRFTNRPLVRNMIKYHNCPRPAITWWALKVCHSLKGCVSLDPSKISKSGWWGLQLDARQLCNSLWYGLINSKLHINKKIFFLYHTTSDGVTVQCFKSPSWPLRDGLDLWPQLIYTLSWESQHEEM